MSVYESRGFRLWLVVSLLIFATACRTSSITGESNVASTAASTPPNILIVAIGGWHSCATPVINPTPENMLMYAQTRNLAQELRAGGATVQFLSSCLRYLPPKPENPTWVVTSDNLNNIRSMKIANFPADIEATWNRLGRPTIYLIGHSYGGHMAMWTALNLQNVPAVGGLYTIDPIGTECLVVENFPWQGGSADCQRSPTSLVVTGLANEVSGRWSNFYQSLGSIHATPIKEATSNQELQIQDGQLSLAHRRMGYDNTIWQTICKDISNDFQLNTSNCRPITVNQDNGQIDGNGGNLFLDSGSYSGNANNPCRHQVTVKGSAVSIKFSNCTQHDIGADLTCKGSTCSGNEYFLGPLGNKRFRHPFRQDYFMRVVDGTTYLYTGDGAGAQPLTMIRIGN